MNIVIIGHTVGVRICIEAVRAQTDHKIVAIYTHPQDQHSYDLELFKKYEAQWGNFAYNVFDAKKDFSIPVIEYKDLNTQVEIDSIKKYEADIIVTIGCREIFKPLLIDSFKFCINLHPFDIPQWRGGGIDSWMILNNAWNTTQYLTSHFISPKLDAGNILCKIPYQINENDFPLDIFKTRIQRIGNLLLKTLEEIIDGSAGKAQSEEQSYYFPKLYTPRDGKLNLTWNRFQIHKFIYAFSYPYSGSFLYLNDIKISILEAEVKHNENVHPLAIGLIFRKTGKTGFSFFINEGEVHVSKFTCETENLIIKLGKYLS
jgi:methionyl-tRNA formyltransferase